MNLKSPWEFFLGGGGGGGGGGGRRDGVGLWLILLNMGYYTLYEKSCFLEIEN